MTNEQRAIILAMRERGEKYQAIAEKTGIAVGTIRSFFARYNKGVVIRPVSSDICLQCHQPILCRKVKRNRTFCSDQCRSKWWNAHRENLSTASAHQTICKVCRKKIITYSGAKYCSRACYFIDRYKGGAQHG